MPNRPDRDALADPEPWTISADGRDVVVRVDARLDARRAERLAYAILAAVKVAKNRPPAASDPDPLARGRNMTHRRHLAAVPAVPVLALEDHPHPDTGRPAEEIRIVLGREARVLTIEEALLLAEELTARAEGADRVRIQRRVREGVSIGAMPGPDGFDCLRQMRGLPPRVAGEAEEDRLERERGSYWLSDG